MTTTVQIILIKSLSFSFAFLNLNKKRCILLNWNFTLLLPIACEYVCYLSRLINCPIKLNLSFKKVQSISLHTLKMKYFFFDYPYSILISLLNRIHHLLTWNRSLPVKHCHWYQIAYILDSLNFINLLFPLERNLINNLQCKLGQYWLVHNINFDCLLKLHN